MFFDSLKARLHKIIEQDHEGDKASQYFDIALISIIIINIIAVVLETVEPLYQRFNKTFYIIDLISVFIFSIEYIVRVWTCTENKKYSHSFWGRIKYIFSPLALIDLVAVLPFYLMFLPMDLRFIRAIRLLRLFRLLKICRYNAAYSLLGRVFKSKKGELVITLFVVGILLLMASSFMYLAEHGAQPKAFNSIIAAMWWGIATLTTVGYGDIYPVTFFGKLLGGVIAFLGLGLFALPAGIISSGMIDEMRSKKHGVCPNCGHEVSSNE